MFGTRLLPALAAQVDANPEHEAQFGNPVRATSTPGNPFAPMPEGTAAEGGMRARRSGTAFKTLIAPCRSSPTQDRRNRTVCFRETRCRKQTLVFLPMQFCGSILEGSVPGQIGAGLRGAGARHFAVQDGQGVRGCRDPLLVARRPRE